MQINYISIAYQKMHTIVMLHSHLASSGTSTASSPPPTTNDHCQNAMSKKSPGDFIKQVLGRPVIVKLNNGADYRGILSCLDGYMNLAMEQTEEYVDGQLKHKYGDTFIRGNNVLYISAQPKK